MFWAIVWVLLALVSIGLWGIVAGLPAVILAALSEDFGCGGCIIGGLVWCIVQGLWIAWIAFCIVNALTRFGVDIAVF
jgi:hypothetical protein